jgi:DNA-directed RNA polymerase specialized sigma24 family protein
MTKKDLLSDDELVKLLKEGNALAYSEIYNRYAESLAGFAGSKLYHLEDARDLLHDLFTKLWEDRHTLVVTSNLKSYLFSALRYKVIDKIRHNVTIHNFVNQCQDLVRLENYGAQHKLESKELEAVIERLLEGERCTFLGYSGSCWDFPSPPSGSDSGYGSASSPGGGAPSGENQISPPPSISPSITIAPNTRPCLDSLKNLVINASEFSVTMTNLLGVVSGSPTKAQHAVLSLANAPNRSISLGEESYPPTTIILLDGTEQVTDKHGETNPLTGNIRLNTLMMNEATDLAIAATLIHESMHSYFVWGAKNLTGNDMMAFSDLNRYPFDPETYSPITYNNPELAALQHANGGNICQFYG